MGKIKTEGKQIYGLKLLRGNTPSLLPLYKEPTMKQNKQDNTHTHARPLAHERTHLDNWLCEKRHTIGVVP